MWHLKLCYDMVLIRFSMLNNDTVLYNMAQTITVLIGNNSLIKCVRNMTGKDQTCDHTKPGPDMKWCS